MEVPGSERYVFLNYLIETHWSHWSESFVSITISVQYDFIICLWAQAIYRYQSLFGTFKLLVLVVFHFIRDQVVGAADSVEMPRLPSHQIPSPASSGGAQGVPRPAERHIPSSMSSVSSRWDVSGTPSKQCVQEASDTDAKATSTDSSICGGAAALL
ncbi:hypothetical protein CHARACLAT_010587 [Characodon lateralis]|uniref:Uncharacterized protein n=1 Tax=Characodon lateralis TaxID=208331 RepID=A0ABU7CZJ5_9TELE|nr:hypothetical protein [Characodon lateralis]